MTTLVRSTFLHDTSRKRRPRRDRMTPLRADGLYGRTYATAAVTADTTNDTDIRSSEMHYANEALVRERIQEREQRSREARLASEIAARRRWHRVSRYAIAAEKRHAQRVAEIAHAR